MTFCAVGGIPDPQEPVGLFMIGGRDASLQGLSSVEVKGLENCTVPDLPEWRYN